MICRVNRCLPVFPLINQNGCSAVACFRTDSLKVGKASRCVRALARLWPGRRPCLRFRSSICAWRAAMNLRIAGRKQPWKSRHFDQTRFDFLIVALAGVFIAGKVMQTKGLTEKKAARKLRLGAGTEAEEKPARLLSVSWEAGSVAPISHVSFPRRGLCFRSRKPRVEFFRRRSPR